MEVNQEQLDEMVVDDLQVDGPIEDGLNGELFKNLLGDEPVQNLLGNEPSEDDKQYDPNELD